ncbi:MAG: hypothetical protein N3A38_12855 [Planctomycetota bacterium]|nr:hypothetical protein [Planctomycetota bacterium]
MDIFDAGWAPPAASIFSGRAAVVAGMAGGAFLPYGAGAASGTAGGRDPSEAESAEDAGATDGGAASDAGTTAAARGYAARGGCRGAAGRDPGALRFVGGLCVAPPAVPLPAGILRCIPIPIEKLPEAAASASSAGAPAVFVQPPPDGYERWRRHGRIRGADFAALHVLGERSIAVLLAPRPGTADVLPIKRAAMALRDVMFVLDGFAGRTRREWLPPARLGRFDNVFVRSCGAPGPGAIRWFVGELGASRLLFASVRARTSAIRTGLRTAGQYGLAWPPKALDMLIHGCPFLTSGDLVLILSGNAGKLWPATGARGGSSTA